jgi:hypothetical protein
VWSVDILSIGRPSNHAEETERHVDCHQGGRLPGTATLTTSTGGLCILMLLVSIHLPAQTQSTKNPAVPEGWLLAGSNPGNYETGLDPQASYHGFPSAYLKAKPSAMEGFGTPHAGI